MTVKEALLKIVTWEIWPIGDNTTTVPTTKVPAETKCYWTGDTGILGHFNLICPTTTTTTPRSQASAVVQYRTTDKQEYCTWTGDTGFLGYQIKTCK